MMKPKRKDSPITTGSFRLFVRHVPTRSPIGDMASSAPSVKSIIPASKSTAPKRKQSRMLEEMGAITKQSTSTIAMIGSTACNASFHFSRSFFVIPNIPLSCLFEADIPILSKSALLLGFFPHSCSLRQVFHEQGMPLQDMRAFSATIL